MRLLNRIVVRLKSPSGSGRGIPSESLNQAMVSLADTDEMRPLLREAFSKGKALVIDIVQDRTGRPIFAYFKTEEL